MHHIDLVLWLIGWPLYYDIEKYLSRREKTDPATVLFHLVMWIGIAYLLYKTA